MTENGIMGESKGMEYGKENNGDSYIGEWKNSKAHGYGVHTWSSGDKYEGKTLIFD